MVDARFDEVLRDLGDEIVREIENSRVGEIFREYLGKNPDLLHAVANGMNLSTEINLLTLVNCEEVLNEDGEVDELVYVPKTNVIVTDFNIMG